MDFISSVIYFFLAGTYQTLSSCSTRQKQFKRASVSQVVSIELVLAGLQGDK
jgi:hypothetical protein